jgi:alkylation response protein AidB-like acyl-CoA dehydrogenase
MANTKTDWVALAGEIAPQLASSSRTHDVAGTFVASSYDILKKHRFFSLAVPSELGGGGGSYDDLCHAIRILGQHCPSSALALSMHSHVVATTVWKHTHGQPGEKLLRKVADDETVLLSTGATDWVDSNGTMKRVDGGYRVSARKVFGSGAPAAKIIIATAPYDDPHEGWQVLHFPVPMNAEGVSVLEDWDTMGMRGTGSNTVVLDDVFVPDEAIALRRPRGAWHPAWSVVITVAPPLFMAAYVGLAEAATKRALEAARGKEPGAALPFQVGELRNELHAARTLWDRMVCNAANYDFAPDLERANEALVGKTLVAKACVATVEKAMEVAGGRAFFRNFGLEQLLRDVHGAPYHPLPEKRQLHFSGLLALGRDPITGAPAKPRACT